VKHLDGGTCNSFCHVRPHIGGLMCSKRLGKLYLSERQLGIRSGKLSVELGSDTFNTLCRV